MKNINRFDLLKTVIIVALTTAVGFIFYYFHLSQANIMAVYMMGALLVGAVTPNRWYGVIAAFACVLLFNFIFTEPLFAFRVDEAGIVLTSVITFMSAVLISSYTGSIREHSKRLQKDAYRSNLILEISRNLRNADDPGEILETSAAQLNKLFKRDVVCCRTWNHKMEERKQFTEYTAPRSARGTALDAEKELNALRLCWSSTHSTGAETEVMSDCLYHYSPVKSAQKVYGIIGIRLEKGLDDFDKSLFLAIVNQCAMTLEKEFISRKRQEEAAAAREEQLRANLLRSISHDLRTPLTSISGNAGVLLADSKNLDEAHRHAIYQDIYDDSLWLINLVENLLSITRMEGGSVHLNMETELLEEVIDEAMRHINRHKKGHEIHVTQDGDYILVPMDARLMLQVLTNLVDNAIKYTPEGSQILIHSCKKGSQAVIEVQDNGPGIPDDSKEKIFEMFYTTGSRSGDGKRGIGLGLALCRSIILAHSGTIEVLNNKPSGSIFRITLPAQKGDFHE